MPDLRVGGAGVLHERGDDVTVQPVQFHALCISPRRGGARRANRGKLAIIGAPGRQGAGLRAQRRRQEPGHAAHRHDRAGAHLAIGALQAAREAARRVPDDLAVVGFDDIDAASCTTPQLTTVRVPVNEQAMALARLLLSRLDGRHTTSVVLPARLVVRESA
ncbi:substrate-binding domain-containing protein [Nonomuraea sp. NPDC005983]|uniref:substrate-binding domain-containing protein n=1 Tax=Nonomuraea sp. NPDC005983 TaxID=3155595 RepID=UPI0033A23894